MHPKIEDLRKKAFVLYSGMDGVELVNKEIKKTGMKEDKLNEYQLKIVLNNIIKNVFIDHVGYEKAKEMLAMDAMHVPGYHTMIAEEMERIHIFERINFMKVLVVAIVLALILLVVGAWQYMSTFNKEELCETKKDASVRDNCFFTLALSIGNLSLCDKMSNHAALYNCYAQIGLRKNDIGACTRIPAGDVELIGLHDKCITCVAYNLNNASLCKNFLSPIKQDDCLSQIERGSSLSC